MQYYFQNGSGVRVAVAVNVGSAVLLGVATTPKVAVATGDLSGDAVAGIGVRVLASAAAETSVSVPSTSATGVDVGWVPLVG